jgi:hypothetical protein
MATFVRVTRDESGDLIFVNMDKVFSMERDQKYTILRPNNAGVVSETVKETPEEIINQIHHERKA